MLLTIDVGNTQTVLGLFAGERLRRHWRVATDRRRTADEWQLLISGLLAGVGGGNGADAPDGAGGGSSSVDGIAACSTVPAVLRQLRTMVDGYYADLPAVVVEPGVRTGVPVLTDNPREVGADRIVNTLAAAHLVAGPAIVVDFGTATTFDVVSGRGEYLGGAIAPGIEVSLEALGERGAQLHRVELARPRSVIGKSTVEALQSGSYYGAAGQVDGIVARMIAELGLGRSDVTVIATGGLAPVVVDEATTIDRHEPWLTLVGLRLIFERNVGRIGRPDEPAASA